MGRSQVERNRRLGRPGRHGKAKGSVEHSSGRGTINGRGIHGHGNNNNNSIRKDKNAWKYDEMMSNHVTSESENKEEGKEDASNDDVVVMKNDFLESEAHSLTMAGGSYYHDANGGGATAVGGGTDDSMNYYSESHQNGIQDVIQNATKTLSTISISKRLHVPLHLTTNNPNLEQLYHHPQESLSTSNVTMPSKVKATVPAISKQQQQQEKLEHYSKEHIKVKNGNEHDTKNRSNNNHNVHNDNEDTNEEEKDDAEEGQDDDGEDGLEDWLDSVIA